MILDSDLAALDPGSRDIARMGLDYLNTSGILNAVRERLRDELLLGDSEQDVEELAAQVLKYRAELESVDTLDNLISRIGNQNEQT